jgi:hypothetical protein
MIVGIVWLMLTLDTPIESTVIPDGVMRKEPILRFHRLLLHLLNPFPL